MNDGSGDSQQNQNQGKIKANKIVPVGVNNLVSDENSRNPTNKNCVGNLDMDDQNSGYKFVPSNNNVKAHGLDDSKYSEAQPQNTTYKVLQHLLSINHLFFFLFILMVCIVSIYANTVLSRVGPSAFVLDWIFYISISYISLRTDHIIWLNKLNFSCVKLHKILEGSNLTCYEK